MEHFEKSIIPVIESVYPSFTPLERTVADFFIHNTDESDLSARHVSELLYVSEASLSRFAKKCGYTGYREFVYRYQEGLNAALPGTDDHIKQVLNTYQELLNKSYSLADRAQIDRICHILTSKRRVYVYGLGSSGLSAQEMKLRFMLAGVDIEAITDIHIMKMNAVLLNESCAAIGITVSGQTPEVSVVGIVNIKGNISTIHSYNRRKVKEEDIPKYGKTVGTGTLIIGISLVLGFIVSFWSEIIIDYIILPAVIVGLGFILYGQFKYNKGIF